MKKPTVLVSLRDVASEMDVPNDDWTVYLNRRTGELVTVTDEEARLVEDGGNEEALPDWQAEQLPKVREVLGSTEFLALPSKFEIHEYQIMERFCHQVADAKVCGDLLRAIRGAGAFGRFKTLVQHCGLVDEWHRYRDRAFEDVAADWLDAHGISYTREATLKGDDDA